LQNPRLGEHADSRSPHQTDFKQLMNLPFSREAFFAVFANYNDAVWPMPLLWLALGMAAAALTKTPNAFTGRAVATVLAALWAWMGIVYHLQYFSQINPIAWWFGAVFVLAAAAFAWFGVWHDGLRFDAASAGGGMPPRVRATAGWGLVIIALFVYPMIGVALGHRFPAMPTFGAPCPSTVYTIGLLVLAGPNVPRVLFVVPLLWAAVGALGAFTLGVTQDLVLLVAAAVALLVMVRGRAAAAPHSASASR
jgi:Family of unknown function (DUF6064)